MPKIKVSLFLTTKNDNIDFEYISKRLDIEPTYTRKKSDFPIQSIKLGFAKNGWVIHTNRDYSFSVSDQVEKIQNMFIGKEHIVCELCKKYSLKVTLEIVIEMEEGNPPEIVLSPENIKFLSQINARLAFDIYIE